MKEEIAINQNKMGNGHRQEEERGKTGRATRKRPYRHHRRKYRECLVSVGKCGAEFGKHESGEHEIQFTKHSCITRGRDFTETQTTIQTTNDKM